MTLVPAAGPALGFSVTIPPHVPQGSTPTSRIDKGAATGSRGGPSLDDVVWGLIERTFRSGHLPERRRAKRFPYSETLLVTPLADDGETAEGPSFTASGKHISATGLGFCHAGRLSARRVMVTFDAGHGELVHLELDLRWCCFIRDNWYESGGRFVRIAPSNGKAGSPSSIP